MLPAYFLKTKLLPPRLTTRVLARPRLIERMRDFLDRPATILCANAGCGKTTLVTDFIHSIKLPAVWYQIDPADVDLAVFFGYLVYGLRQREPLDPRPIYARPVDPRPIDPRPVCRSKHHHPPLPGCPEFSGIAAEDTKPRRAISLPGRVQNNGYSRRFSAFDSDRPRLPAAPIS